MFVENQVQAEEIDFFFCRAPTNTIFKIAKLGNKQRIQKAGCNKK